MLSAAISHGHDGSAVLYAQLVAYSATIETTHVHQVYHNGYAPPLIPLNSRDMEALGEFFAAVDMEAISLDIALNLTVLSPEPCWDDYLVDLATALDLL